ncbi:MAG TPA: polysaccharide deacetylase family protein [Alphaproteobacteria bacterium]|nr:polysaccharide deacetylase family protein [Alphaproteobacteria bacterium]
MITFTVDLEDPTGQYGANGRYVLMTRRILDMCDELGRKATFFTIGRIAGSAPDLIKDISARGHEVAYHSRNHISLTEDDPHSFRKETAEDKEKFEQLTGKPVAGFRAPRFSLTPKSRWAIDVLGELGFKYSSSIMPTQVSRFGFPEASRLPFKWPNDLIELPLPVGGPNKLPYLGGIYLYAMPFAVTRMMVKRADPKEVLWTYTHPYDFDRDEKFQRMPDDALWVSVVLWLARRVAENKIRKVLSLGPAGTMAERAAANFPGTYS